MRCQKTKRDGSQCKANALILVVPRAICAETARASKHGPRVRRPQLDVISAHASSFSLATSNSIQLE